jgi:hypothetical protein
LFCEKIRCKSIANNYEYKFLAQNSIKRYFVDINTAALVLAANPATGVDLMIIPAIVALAAVIVFGVIGIVRKKRENSVDDAEHKKDDNDEQDDE